MHRVSLLSLIVAALFVTGCSTTIKQEAEFHSQFTRKSFALSNMILVADHYKLQQCSPIKIDLVKQGEHLPCFKATVKAITSRTPQSVQEKQIVEEFLSWYPEYQ